MKIKFVKTNDDSGQNCYNNDKNDSRKKNLVIIFDDKMHKLKRVESIVCLSLYAVSRRQVGVWLVCRCFHQIVVDVFYYPVRHSKSFSVKCTPQANRLYLLTVGFPLRVFHKWHENEERERERKI